LLAKLGDLKSPLTLEDATGRVLAYLTPAEDRSIYDELDMGISVEELNRRIAKGGGISFAEMMAECERRANGGGK
jgi:hypothetical protein